MTGERARELAERLEAAWRERSPVEPLTETEGLSDVDDAYAVQQAWTDLRRSAGDTVLGRKIGLTSEAVQQQLGVAEPDYGALWASRFYEAADGRAVAPAGAFLQPRVEGELAFLLGTPPAGPDVSVEDVLANTEAVAPALEIVDSRIADWRIKLADTVADNASFGGFTLGPWSRDLARRDLREVGMTLSRGVDRVCDGVGAAALGHPARAVAWLLNRLTELEVEVEAGAIILSGALAPMAPAARGDVFMLDVDGQPSLTLAFD